MKFIKKIEASRMRHKTTSDVDVSSTLLPHHSNDICLVPDSPDPPNPSNPHIADLLDKLDRAPSNGSLFADDNSMFSLSTDIQISNNNSNSGNNSYGNSSCGGNNGYCDNNGYGGNNSCCGNNSNGWSIHEIESDSSFQNIVSDKFEDCSGNFGMDMSPILSYHIKKHKRIRRRRRMALRGGNKKHSIPKNNEHGINIEKNIEGVVSDVHCKGNVEKHDIIEKRDRTSNLSDSSPLESELFPHKIIVGDGVSDPHIHYPSLKDHPPLSSISVHMLGDVRSRASMKRLTISGRSKKYGSSANLPSSSLTTSSTSSATSLTTSSTALPDISSFSTSPPSSSAIAISSFSTSPTASTTTIMPSFSTSPTTSTTTIMPSFSTSSTTTIMPSFSTSPPTSFVSTSPTTSTTTIMHSFSTSPTTSTTTIMPSFSTSPPTSSVSTSPSTPATYEDMFANHILKYNIDEYPMEPPTNDQLHLHYPNFAQRQIASHKIDYTTKHKAHLSPRTYCLSNVNHSSNDNHLSRNDITFTENNKDYSSTSNHTSATPSLDDHKCPQTTDPTLQPNYRSPNNEYLSMSNHLSDTNDIPLRSVESFIDHHKHHQIQSSSSSEYCSQYNTNSITRTPRYLMDPSMCPQHTSSSLANNIAIMDASVRPLPTFSSPSSSTSPSLFPSEYYSQYSSSTNNIAIMDASIHPTPTSSFPFPSEYYSQCSSSTNNTPRHIWDASIYSLSPSEYYSQCSSSTNNTPRRAKDASARSSSDFSPITSPRTSITKHKKSNRFPKILKSKSTDSTYHLEGIDDSTSVENNKRSRKLLNPTSSLNRYKSNTHRVHKSDSRLSIRRLSKMILPLKTKTIIDTSLNNPTNSTNTTNTGTEVPSSISNLCPDIISNDNLNVLFLFEHFITSSGISLHHNLPDLTREHVHHLIRTNENIVGQLKKTSSGKLIGKHIDALDEESNLCYYDLLDSQTQDIVHRNLVLFAYK